MAAKSMTVHKQLCDLRMRWFRAALRTILGKVHIVICKIISGDSRDMTDELKVMCSSTIRAFIIIYEHKSIYSI